MGWTVELKKVKIECKINLTADHWQLYNLEGRASERDKVAENLNRAVEAKLAAGELSNLPSVLYPFKEWGATDTEGYYTLQHILEMCNIDYEAYI